MASGPKPRCRGKGWQMSRPAPRCWDLPISSKLLGPPLGTEIRLEMWRKARDAVEGHAGGAHVQGGLGGKQNGAELKKAAGGGCIPLHLETCRPPSYHGLGGPMVPARKGGHHLTTE
jgi:hypothetical protein